MYSRWTLFLSVDATIQLPMHLRCIGPIGPLFQNLSARRALCCLVGAVVVASHSSSHRSLVGWVRPVVHGPRLWPIDEARQPGSQEHVLKKRNALLSLSVVSCVGTTHREYVRLS